MPELPIICDLNALTNNQRQWLITEFRKLFGTVAKVKSLPTGYGFYFEDIDENQFTHIAKLIALDRLCCTFILHEIIQPAGSMDVWLHFTSTTDIKAYLESDISQLVGKTANVISLIKRQNANASS